MELKLHIDFSGFEFDPNWTEEELGKRLVDFVADTCTISENPLTNQVEIKTLELVNAVT